MHNNDRSITTMQELLEDFIGRGNKIKEKILSEKEIYMFSQPISKTQYEELCNYKEKGFNVEKIKSSVKISPADSKIMLFFPSSDLMTNFILNINPNKILSIFTLFSFLILGLTYWWLAADFASLRIYDTRE